MGEQGVMMTMRVGKVVRRVVMTMRKVVRAMRREENTTTRDSLASEGERPRGRFWGLLEQSHCTIYTCMRGPLVPGPYS